MSVVVMGFIEGARFPCSAKNSPPHIIGQNSQRFRVFSNIIHETIADFNPSLVDGEAPPVGSI